MDEGRDIGVLWGLGGRDLSDERFKLETTLYVTFHVSISSQS